MDRPNWKKMTVGELCDTISDTYCRNDNEVVLINTSDVLEGKVLNHNRVENKQLKGQFKKTFKKDDILYSEIRPANKRYAFVDFEDTKQYIASTKLMVLRANKELVLPRFLFSFLTSNKVLAELQLLAETRSGTFPQITFSSELATMTIFVPDFSIQEKIVGIIENIDAKIQNNSRINDNLSKQLRLFFQHYFIDDVHSNWPVEKLGNFLSLERGLSYKGKFLSDSTGVPMVNLGNILPNSIFRPEKLKYYTGDFKAKAIVKPGDIIVANTDLTQAREVLGSAILIPDLGCSTIICSHHISIVRNCQLPKHFIHGLLNSPKYRERVIGFATGTTVLALPNETILNCEFSMPPIELMSEYESMAESVYQKQEQIRKENQQLTTLRDVLLPKLMSGELDVSCLDI